jgi:hypothetical protein
MWRFIILVRRAENCTVDQFKAAWLDVVAPQVVARAGEAGPVARASINMPPPQVDPRISAMVPQLSDGMVELWFDQLQMAHATLAKLADGEFVGAREVIDQGRSLSWLAQVRPVKPDEGTTVTFTSGGEVKDSSGLDEARRYWGEEHPRVARTAPEVWGLLSKYTQFHGEAPVEMPGFFAPPRFVPMCADMGFAKQDDFVQMYTCEQYRTIGRPDEKKFSVPAHAYSFLTGERRLAAG